MNHDKYKHKGKAYQAVKAKNCKGCQLWATSGCKVAPCLYYKRTDLTSVSYKLHLNSHEVAARLRS